MTQTITWNTSFTADELKQYFFEWDSNNLRRSKANQDWWMARTVAQLEALKAGAWYANDRETFVVTTSLLANFNELSAKFQAKAA